MKKLLRVAGGLIATFALLALIIGAARAVRLRSVQVPPGVPAAIVVDRQAAASRLAALVRVPTVSWGDASKRDLAAFDRVQEVLAGSFPGVHREFTREVVDRWSLLYTWRATRTDLPPLIFTAHLDVVPVEPGTEAQWAHPPFDGVVADGSIWGRGTVDDKAGVAGVLEAAEALLASGFKPARTIYLAFGHNEEGGGDASGAAAIAGELFARGIRNAWLMDEGGLIYREMVGVHQPVALVGIAEKRSMTLELVAHSAGGHASMPPAETAVGTLARALERLERRQMPARLEEPTRKMFDTLAPEMSFGMKMALANLWLTRPLLVHLLTAAPQTNAIVRTTTAPTMLEGSPKFNVLASEARAVINFRLLPGDTSADVESHVRAVVNDARVEIRVLGAAAGASAVASVDTPEFRALAGSIRAVYPDVLVAPFLTIAATDAREYAAVAPNTYRFLPIYQDGVLESIHGTNEHVRIDAYDKAIRVYATIMQSLAR